MRFTFEQMKPFLKLSKSAPIDTGPYLIVRDADSEWFNIIDWNGAVVGQTTAGRLMAARLMHSGGCSNQNPVHPDGAFSGAQECGCQSCEFCGCFDCPVCSCGAPCEHGCSGRQARGGCNG